MIPTGFDFTAADSVTGWAPIDDRVMGGISHSHLRHDPAGHAVFEGLVSFERNGGFASVRVQATDLAGEGVTAYLLAVRADGKRYRLNLRLDHGFDGINYQASFLPPVDDWAQLRLPLADFQPTFRGRTLADAPPLDPARVRQVGLMIADRQGGRFSLALRSIGVECTDPSHAAR
jgi:hypothetical protein